jgi:hypothetical protein
VTARTTERTIMASSRRHSKRPEQNDALITTAKEIAGLAQNHQRLRHQGAKKLCGLAELQGGA